MLFYSDILKKRDDTVSYGAAHYSLSIPAARIMSFFKTKKHICRPEIYGTELSRTMLGMDPTKKNVHISFRSFNETRFLKGAYNISYVLWEFLHIDNNVNGRLWAQLDLIEKCDEVWSAASFSQELISKHIKKEVHHIPCPVNTISPLRLPDSSNTRLSLLRDIPAQTVSLFFGADNISWIKRETKPLHSHINSKKCKIYITVLNPHDFRKNIESIIRGFAVFSRKNENSFLIIKLIIDNINDTIDNIQDNIIKNRFTDGSMLYSKNILLISKKLSLLELDELYRTADYYICLSHGEGQNLPLLEAMGQGVVPISVSNSAMSDYINDENSFVVKSSIVTKYLPLASEFTNSGYVTCYDVDLKDYIDALETSLSISNNRFLQLRYNSIVTAINYCGYDSVRKKLLSTRLAEFIDENNC